MKHLLVMALVLGALGCQDKVKFRTIAGTPGIPGESGPAGSGCIVEQLEAGALITCGNTSAIVRNGIDGVDGQSGVPGQDGQNGQNGSPGQSADEHGKSDDAPGHNK